MDAKFVCDLLERYGDDVTVIAHKDGKFSDIKSITVERTDGEKEFVAVLDCDDSSENINTDGEINTVNVRWWDGYLEIFEATEVRFGSDLLWMRLTDGENRHIPLRMVRWFSTSIESHQKK